MKNIMLIFLSIFIISVFCAHGTNSTTQLAEDIWGNKIDIQKAIQSSKPTVIVPFSTSNCGYCLIDGFFTEKNYI